MRKLFYVFLIICASCKDEDVNEMSGDDCIDPNRWGVIEGCYKIYDPVCGCNAVTYGNDCEVKMAGVVTWSKGKCPS
jgi:hypothetical protein